MINAIKIKDEIVMVKNLANVVTRSDTMKHNVFLILKFKDGEEDRIFKYRTKSARDKDIMRILAALNGAYCTEVDGECIFTVDGRGIWE